MTKNATENGGSRKHTRGRGSNPASRANLQPQQADNFVLELVEGMLFQVFSGPTTRTAAYNQAQRLNAHYPAGKGPFIVAGLNDAREHDGFGVAQAMSTKG